MLFEASIKEAGVVEAGEGCDAGDGIGGRQQKVFCVVKPLLNEVFRDGLSHMFFERIANVLLRIRNVFCDFANGHIVEVGRAK